jgi:hypothetical protein
MHAPMGSGNIEMACHENWAENWLMLMLTLALL